MDKVPKIVKIFGCLIILQGIIVYLIPAIYGLNGLGKYKGSDFAMFGFFIGPLIFVLFFGYLGWNLIKLKKSAFRQCIYVSIFFIVIGTLQLIWGVSIERLIGLLPIVFYGLFLYFIIQPNTRSQFK